MAVSSDLCCVEFKETVGDEERGLENGDGAAHAAVVDDAAAIIEIDDVVAGNAAGHHDIGGKRQADGPSELGRRIGAEVDPLKRHAVAVPQQDGPAALHAGKKAVGDESG